MAHRIADLPDDESDWPDLEDELIPDTDPLPEAGGPFTRCFEYLHGARATLDADLTAPTRLLTATAARSILRIAEETGSEIPPEDRSAFERIAEGEIPEDQAGMLETLARLSAFVERRIQAARRDP